MIEINTDVNGYDSCGNIAIAKIEFDNCSIKLCRECLSELTVQLNKFNSTIHCEECKWFIMSESGWNYGGSCKKKAIDDGYMLLDEDAGYHYCVDCMDTCDFAERTEIKS